ncbi:MAG: YXWGXW repeat-containing protein, partial [Candidatus Eisenbacteria bacterium]|nr:YXWGXW repeat-containing protein [Candidatus Eisenbacteria bacterium]
KAHRTHVTVVTPAVVAPAVGTPVVVAPAVGSPVVVAPAVALTRATVHVAIPAAPPVKVVVADPAPRKDWIWVSGHWDWRPVQHRWVWVEGHWVKK